MKREDSGIGELLVNTSKYPNPPGAPYGLHIIPNWISEAEEKAIVDFLCVGEWSKEISTKRPTKHFGYRYHVNGYFSSEEKEAKDWGILRTLADRIEKEFPGIKIAQCLANLYYRDSTIGAHRDKGTPVVFGVSTAGDINMVWTNMKNPTLKYEALIPRRSLYIMCDDAAYDWMHAVPGRKTVTYPEMDPVSPNYGKLVHNVQKPEWYTRASITYRHFTNSVV